MFISMNRLLFQLLLFSCLIPIQISAQGNQGTAVTRNTCIEVFTGTWCAPCRFAGTNFRYNILPNIDHYTVIQYHQGPDYFATWEGHNRIGHYGLNYVPAFLFDGCLQNPGIAIFDSLKMIPAYMEINISDAHYHDSTVTVSGNILPHIDYDTGSYVLQVVVIENENSLHPYSSWDTSYIYIEVEMDPQEDGTPIQSLLENVPIYFNQTFSLHINKIQSMNNLKIVVFVQNINDMVIHQSAWEDITFSNGIINLNKNKKLIISPNPVVDNFSVSFSNWHILR